MTNTLKTQKPEIKWIANNPITRKYEEIDIETAELLPGQTAMKLYYCRSFDKYVTIPGDCIYRMNANYELVLDEE